MCIRESGAVLIAVVEWLVTYQWRTAGDMPPTTSQYSADTRSNVFMNKKLWSQYFDHSSCFFNPELN